MGNQSNVEIRIGTSYDSSGMREAESDLDRYRRATEQIQRDEQQRLAQAKQYDLQRGQQSPRQLATTAGVSVRGGALTPEHMAALRELGIQPDVMQSIQQAAGGGQAPPPTSPPGSPPAHRSPTSPRQSGMFDWRSVVGLGLFEAIRGMPTAEREAALRYQVAAPGVRPAGASVDQFGTQVSEVGRAMAYSREETLQAAAAYNRLAGTVGRELTPELRQLTQAARYHRMELGEAVQYFGGMRRLTRADDPQAMQMIGTTVRAAMEGSGRYRRDELRDALRSLAERSTQGMPGGLTSESMLTQATLASMLHRTGMPGLQGTVGADVLGRAFNMGFDANDPNSVIRMRLLQGRTDRLRGNPLDVMGEAAEQLERFKSFQWNDTDVKDIFRMVQNAGGIGGASTPAGIRMTLRRTGVFDKLTQHELAGLQDSLLNGGEEQFLAQMDLIRQQRTQTPLGPDQQQRRAMHLQNQQSRRQVTDALGTLGTYATQARNIAYQSVSGAFGGGSIGDIAALGLGGMAQLGGLYMGYGTLRRMGVFGRGRGAGGTGSFWRRRLNLFGGHRRGFGGGSARRAGLGRISRSLLRRNGRIASGLGAIAGFAAEGYLKQIASEMEGSKAARYQMAAHGAGIASWAMAGGSVAGIPGAIVGGTGAAVAKLGMSGVSLDKHGNEVGSRGFWDDAVASGGVGWARSHLPPAWAYFRVRDRLTYGNWNYRADVDADAIRGSEQKLSRMRGDPAAFKLLKEMYGDHYSEALNAYQLRRDRKVGAGAAFQDATEKMEQEFGIKLTDEQREKARATLAPPQAAAHRTGGAGDGRLAVDVNVRFAGNQDQAAMGREIGEQVGQALRQELPNIYEPIHSGWSTNGRLS